MATIVAQVEATAKATGQLADAVGLGSGGAGVALRGGVEAGLEGGVGEGGSARRPCAAACAGKA